MGAAGLHACGQFLVAPEGWLPLGCPRRRAAATGSAALPAEGPDAAGGGGEQEEGAPAERLLLPPRATENARRRSSRLGGQVFRRLREGESILDRYELSTELSSNVFAATRRADGAEVVVKVRHKRANAGSEQSWRAAMSQIHQLRASPHVLGFSAIYEDDASFYVVMPKCNGGELFQFLENEEEVPEVECKRIIREILIAVGQLHEKGLVHRDIKPENIMFENDAEDAKTPKVKLIDFDCCVEWTPRAEKAHVFVGTPGYIAPEALLGEITPQSDLWSVGVILFILMTGDSPWNAIEPLQDGSVSSPGAKRMYKALKAEVLDWDAEPWREFPLARDLCQRLIAFDTKDRLCSVQEALGHPWLADPPPPP